MDEAPPRPPEDAGVVLSFVAHFASFLPNFIEDSAFYTPPPPVAPQKPARAPPPPANASYY